MRQVAMWRCWPKPNFWKCLLCKEMKHLSLHLFIICPFSVWIVLKKHLQLFTSSWHPELYVFFNGTLEGLLNICKTYCILNQRRPSTLAMHWKCLLCKEMKHLSLHLFIICPFSVWIVLKKHLQLFTSSWHPELYVFFNGTLEGLLNICKTYCILNQRRPSTLAMYLNKQY